MEILPIPMIPGFGRGWGTAEVTCPACGYLWVATAPMGIKALECPSCGGFSEQEAFTDCPIEAPNDGCWITGRLDGDF